LLELIQIEVKNPVGRKGAGLVKHSALPTVLVGVAESIVGDRRESHGVRLLEHRLVGDLHVRGHKDSIDAEPRIVTEEGAEECRGVINGCHCKDAITSHRHPSDE
jgi:hypothetical protein